MHSHIIVKGRLARVLFFKKRLLTGSVGGCASAMKMKWLSFCIALGLHYLCKEGKNY